MARWCAFFLFVACVFLVIGRAPAGKPSGPGGEQASVRADPLPPRAVGRLGTTRLWRGPVNAVAFSPDNRVLASGGDDRLVRLWDPSSGREVRRLKGHEKPILCVAFSPDGRTVAAAGGSPDGQESPILLWDLVTGKESARLLGNRGQVFSVAFSPDGKTLFAGSDAVHAWDLTGRGASPPARDLNLPDLGGSISGLAYAPNGQSLAVASFAGRVLLHDLRAGKTRRLPARPTDQPVVAYSRDGKVLGSAGGDRLRLWATDTAREVASLGDGVSCFALDARGKTAAWAERDNAVRYGEIGTGKESVPFTGHWDRVTCLAFSSDGRTLASASKDGTVLLWDTRGGGQSRAFTLTAPQAAQAAWEKRPNMPVPEDARVSLRVDKEQFFLGEDIRAEFQVENAGKGIFYIDLGGDYRLASRHLRFSVKATDARGKAVADPDPSGYCLGGLSWSKKLTPGARHAETLALTYYCRFEEPGVYRLRVTHDLGWTPAEGRPTPAAKATLRLVRPTAEQARQIVEERYRAKDADFSTLAYPVYLPILVPRAARGDGKALQALGQIPTPEATEALIRLLDHKDARFAREALQTLCLRLPDPQLEGKLHKRNAFDNDLEDRRRWLSSQGWRAEFAPAVRKAGRRLLRRADRESLEGGAFVLECLGNKEDLPDLVHGLDEAVAESKSLPLEEGYPRPRGACGELVRAARMMSLRGVPPPTAPRSAGERILFATAVGARQDFRPDGWEAEYARLLQDEFAYVREVGLDHLPVPVPKSLLKLLPALLADRDINVQIAACAVAAKAKAPGLREAVLRVLASAREEWQLQAADDAAWALGARLESTRVLVSRLDEDGMAAACLQHLTSAVLSDASSYSCPTREMLDVVAGRSCKAAWLEFLAKHGKDLQTGKRFRLADPALPLKELFPGFTFYR